MKLVLILLALQSPTFSAPPTQIAPDMPVKVATQDCRNIGDEMILKATGIEPPRYSQVFAGKGYAISPSPIPGAVFAIPVNRPGEGTSEVRQACFD